MSAVLRTRLLLPALVLLSFSPFPLLLPLADSTGAFPLLVAFSSITRWR